MPMGMKSGGMTHVFDVCFLTLPGICIPEFRGGQRAAALSALVTGDFSLFTGSDSIAWGVFQATGIHSRWENGE